MTGNITADVEPDAGSVKKVYRAGTLEYTKRGLVVLFIWLLWGDFCFSIMENVIPTITPITMRNLGSSNLLISLVITTIPSIFNFVICPWVSFKSDRHRSKWGRRRPFLLFPTPFIALFLILIGLSPDIGKWLATGVFLRFGWSHTTITLAMIAVFSAAFQYFNMFVASVYYYLFNDVVPEQYLSRFMSMFKMVGTLAGAAFSFFIFPHAETHMREIFIGIGLLYFVAFTVMTLKTKEGEYPPPPENIDGKPGVFSSMKTYFVECFSHRFYWLFFLATTCNDVSYIIGPFQVFLQQKALGLTLRQIGVISGVALVAGALIVLPAGVLADKKHPLRTWLLSVGGMACVHLVRLIYLFFDFPPQVAFKTEFGLTMVIVTLFAIYSASSLPMYMRLLPSDRFGQYCAAQAMVRSFAVIFLGMAAGGFMDLMKKICAGHGMPPFYYYKFTFIWWWMFQTIAVVLMLVVYRYWKKYGGDESYKPPAAGRVVESQGLAKGQQIGE